MIELNINYKANSNGKNLLDVIYKPGTKDLPVIFFIHGGSWMTGSKDMYTGLGENFLEKGFVSVIISYRLFPSVDIFGMTEDCQAAFKWCKENIKQYGGNSQKIYLMGHSAGGHLAALTGLLEEGVSGHVAGFVLIDAFGLSAYYFLSEHSAFIPKFFAGIFGTAADRWPLVSPDKLLRKDLPPFLVLTGGNTYPFVNFDNSNFVGLLNKLSVPNEHKVISGKTHMQMILEFESSKSKMYKDVIDWITAHNLKG